MSNKQKSNPIKSDLNPIISDSNIKKIMILSSLFFLWVGLTLWYIVIFDNSALVLSYNHGEENFISKEEGRLTKGEKLSGKFTARENNLGIVAIRFKKFQRIPWDQEDKLIFRIKENGSDKWYYSGEYMSGLTFDVPFLPFGFPVIPDSKGKTYYFELESLRGNKVNGLVLSDRKPFLVSKYQKEKSVLLQSPEKLTEFSAKKFFNSFGTIDISYSSYIFALPLIFYLVWISSMEKLAIIPPFTYISKNSKILGKKIFGKNYKFVANSLSLLSYHWMFVVTILSVVYDILFLHIQNPLLYISIFFLWLYLAFIYKKDSRVSIATGLGLLLIAPVAYELNSLNIAEKAAAWAFMFFVAGLIGAIRELKITRALSK